MKNSGYAFQQSITLPSSGLTSLYSEQAPPKQLNSKQYHFNHGNFVRLMAVGVAPGRVLLRPSKQTSYDTVEVHLTRIQDVSNVPLCGLI